VEESTLQQMFQRDLMEFSVRNPASLNLCFPFQKDLPNRSKMREVETAEARRTASQKSLIKSKWVISNYGPAIHAAEIDRPSSKRVSAVPVTEIVLRRHSRTWEFLWELRLPSACRRRTIVFRCRDRRLSM